MSAWTLTRRGLLILAFLCVSPLGQAADDEEDPYVGGLVAVYRDGKGAMVRRTETTLSLRWTGQGDDRLAPGSFEVVWTGRLRTEATGGYRLALHGQGEAEVKIDGQVLIPRSPLKESWVEGPPVSLAAGFRSLEIRFYSATGHGRLLVAWSGPQFGREPISPRLLSHARTETAPRLFERGRALTQALRCGRCHEGEGATLPGPALDRLAGQVSRPWLISWLGDHMADMQDPTPRKMPDLGLTRSQAQAIADWLLIERPQTPRPALPQTPVPPTAPVKKGVSAPPRPDGVQGERLFVSLGCLACHSWRGLGNSGWRGGGDLSAIGDKRPAAFFTAWLADPAQFNQDHRMPVFSLSEAERTSLGLFLQQQRSSKPLANLPQEAPQADEGQRLVQSFRCAACHRLPGDVKASPAPPLSRRPAHGKDCLGLPERGRPGYRLNTEDQRAIGLYLEQRHPAGARKTRGLELLGEANCLACHVREGAREDLPLVSAPLADQLPRITQKYPDLARLIPAMTPPALNSVGDKLNEDTLKSVLKRTEVHRPYLQVRMPRFPLSEGQVAALTQALIDEDRLPMGPLASPHIPATPREHVLLAGGRLVSADGFGCTSCHTIGNSVPSVAQVEARGPALSGLSTRIRREWFDRWVRNPSRIVPRMEMPSVQIPIQGMLGDHLDAQLDALWQVLNVPGFNPPAPNPIRILRHDGHTPFAEPLFLTDLLQDGNRLTLKPFVIGLPNRHNILLDLERGNLARWWIGDMARQRTRGKTWFWEQGAPALLEPGLEGPEALLETRGRVLNSRLLSQFLTEADSWHTSGPEVTLNQRLQFDGAPQISLSRTFLPTSEGFRLRLTALGVPQDYALRWHLVHPHKGGKVSENGRTLQWGDRFETSIQIEGPENIRIPSAGHSVLLSPDAKGMVRLDLHYTTKAPVDRLPKLISTSGPPRQADPVVVAPGFLGQRLPLAPDIMPTGLAWRPTGPLVFCTLKGQVFEALDRNGDGAEDELRLLGDGLPTPYGISAESEYVDVSAKFSLLRLGSSAKGRRVETLASGWGYTNDYHEWSIGLPRTAGGDYLLGIPCQQDKRSVDATRFHGNVLRLVPRQPTPDNPHRFTPEAISAGHRFPMGMAINRAGDIFVTDNQGNYNPFNELNHVRPGAHFGFVNTMDRGKPVPPLTAPAIDIPHPWTRSVNGICFLDTPSTYKGTPQLLKAFGPFEGHLIGCEYDTRRLIRMSLQKVGDLYQGAAYPLSVSPEDPARGFLGPVVAAVSPDGSLYVGCIRDSGWGGGNNIGEIVRVRLDPDILPGGLAEMRATPRGFTLDFLRPIDRTRASTLNNYTLQSYRRVATPAYGGPDIDRRTETPQSVEVSPDGRRVTLTLTEMRIGFVYELRLANLAPDRGEFFPAEAHFTLRAVPKEGP